MLSSKSGLRLRMGFNLIVILLCFNPDPLLSQTRESSPENLIDAAKKEGEVVWYTTTSNVDNQIIVKAFNRRYPFLNVQVLRTSGEKLRARILTEVAAGQHFFDVAVLSSMEFGLLKSRNLLQPYRSPESEIYPAGAKDREGYFTGIYARNFVIGYNKSMVSDKDAPRDWPDLLRSEWKEKIGLDEEEFEWYGTLVDYWGREKTINFMKALSGQEPQLRRGHSLLSQLLAAGEFPIAIVFPYHAEQLKVKGAMVDWVRTSDPIVTSISAIALPVKPPHPNAGKLLIDFILSEEGQTIIRDRFRVPVRPGISPAAPNLEQSDLKIHYVPSDLFNKIAEYEKEFREIFWKGR